MAAGDNDQRHADTKLKKKVRAKLHLLGRQTDRHEQHIPPPSADSGLFCANSSRFRPSFSDWILCIAPWYSDSVRSTESRISFTVALKIEFREDSRNSFSSLDLSMFFSAAADCKHLPTRNWRKLKRQQRGEKKCFFVKLWVPPCAEPTKEREKARPIFFSPLRPEARPLLAWRWTAGIKYGKRDYHNIVVSVSFGHWIIILKTGIKS